MTVVKGTQFNVQHFVPGEILVLLRYEDPEFFQTDSNEIIQRANLVIEAINKAVKIYYKPNIYPGLNPTQFQLDFNEGKFSQNNDNSQNHVLTWDDSYAVIPAILENNEGKLASEEDVATYVHFWYENYVELGRIDINSGDESLTIEVLSITPNFFASVSAITGAEGGPGAWPVEDKLEDISTPRFKLIDKDDGRASSENDYASAYRDLELAFSHRSNTQSAVDVVIIDSTYDRNELRKRLDHWTSLRNQSSAHPLPSPQPPRRRNRYAENLGGKIEGRSLIIWDFYPSQSPGSSTRSPELIAQHCYDMRDHGTFCTSIVTEMAPKTRIYLLRAFSDNGVGSMASVADALRWTLNLRRGNNRRMIVNMSFGFELTPSGCRRYLGAWNKEIDTIKLPFIKKGSDKSKPESIEKEVIKSDFTAWLLGIINMLIYAIKSNSNNVEESVAALENELKNSLSEIAALEKELMNSPSEANNGTPKEKKLEEERVNVKTIMKELRGLNDVILVGAAGNDGIFSDKCNDPCDPNILSYVRLPDARYPAAFEEVIGVGALDDDEDLAVYTNEADHRSQLGDGIRTFGGNSKSENGYPTGKTDPEKGMLGLYLGRTIPAKIGDNRFDPTHDGVAMWCGTSFATALVSGTLAMLYADGRDPLDVIEKLYDGRPPKMLPIWVEYI